MLREIEDRVYLFANRLTAFRAGPPGFVCSRPELASPNTLCPAGYYCPNGTMTSDPFRNDTTLRPYPCTVHCLESTAIATESQCDQCAGTAGTLLTVSRLIFALPSLVLIVIILLSSQLEFCRSSKTPQWSYTDQSDESTVHDIERRYRSSIKLKLTFDWESYCYRLIPGIHLVCSLWILLFLRIRRANVPTL